MKKALFVLAFAAVATAGCATRYHVTTSGYLDAAKPAGIPAGASFSLVPNNDVPNPLFDDEVRAKIERALAARGHRIEPAFSADFLVRYRTDNTGNRILTTRPERMYGPSVVQRVYVSGSNQAYNVVTQTDAIYNVPETLTVYTSRLFLEVVPRGAAEGTRPVWVGDSITESANPDLREVIDYLIAATFKYFGQNTGRNKEVTLGPKDPSLVPLQGPPPPPKN